MAKTTVSTTSRVGLVTSFVAVVAACAIGYFKYMAREESDIRLVDRRLLQAKVDQSLPEDSTGAKISVVKDKLGVELYVRQWLAASPPKACIVMVHGFTWHSEYFEETAKVLNRAGYSVVSFDLAAHGLSGSVTGVRGNHFSFTDWVDEAQLVLEHAQQQVHPNVPSFIYGESLGGTVVLTLLQRPAVAATVAGAIAACAATELPPLLPPKPVLALLKLLAWALPLLPIPADKVTAEEEWTGAFGDKELAMRAFHQDPLVAKSTRLGSVGAILPALEAVGRRLDEFRVPLLILQGLDDLRVRPGSAQELHDQAASPDKELHLYEGMRHQLLQETPGNKQRVWGDIMDWLDRHSPVLPPVVARH